MKKHEKKKKWRIVKRIMAVVLAVCMVAGVVPPFAKPMEVKAITTREAAVQWVKNRADEHWNSNDGSGETQCVEFIWAYYRYLLGYTYTVSGHAYQYLTNARACPNGAWTRPDKSTVQPGDIVIWDKGASFNARRSDYASPYMVTSVL